jgi:AcrR family transcriptional regulator
MSRDREGQDEMKKRSERAAETQAALTAAFWELYKEKQIAKITVKEITDRAVFYRSTFYLYYTDVYNVLEQLENHILQDWKRMSDQFLEQGSHDMMLDMIVAFYDQYGEYMSELLSPNGDPTFLQKIKDTLRPMILTLFQVSANDVHVTLIFEYYISAVLAFLTGWYRNGRQIPAQEAVDMVRSLVWDGLTSVIRRRAANPAS